MDFLKSTKGGPFGLAGGRIPETGASARRRRRRRRRPLRSAPACGCSLKNSGFYVFLIFLKLSRILSFV